LAYKSKHEAEWPQDPCHGGLVQPRVLLICSCFVHASDDGDERENESQQYNACTDELQQCRTLAENYQPVELHLHYTSKHTIMNKQTMDNIML